MPPLTFIRGAVCIEAATRTPEAFNKWVRDHADKIKSSKSVPYFIRDNQQRVDRLLGKQKSPQEIAKERHAARTPGDATGGTANGSIAGKLRVIPESECNFTLPNGGSISTPPKRLSKGNYNKQEQGKFEKELRVAKRLAENGHTIVFTEEPPGTPMYDVLFDGKRADIKSLKSHNNLLRECRDAISHQHAEIVLLEFTQRNDKIIQTIQRLSREGIHGKYYFTDDFVICDF